MPYTDLPVRASRSGMARRPPNNPESGPSSRVHLDDEPSPTTITEAVLREYTQESPASTSRESPRLPITPPRPVHSSQPDWHVPDYASPVSRQPRSGLPHPARAVSPLSRGQEGYRESDATEATLFDRGIVQNEKDGAKKNTKSSFSSYRHPYDIRPPNETYGITKSRLRPRPTPGSPPPFNNQDNQDDVSEDEDQGDEECPLGDREDRQRGYLSNLIELYANESEEDGRGDRAAERRMDETRVRIMHRINRYNSMDSDTTSSTRPVMKRTDSLASNDSQVIDPDDPIITGEHKRHLHDAQDLEDACLKQMTYQDRRKYQQRIRIEYNITSILNRQQFLMHLAKALMMFGAPSHRIESQLLSAARILEVDAEFVHIPGVIICSFSDHETKTSEMRFIKAGGRLALGCLHEVHSVYRSVVHDEISARKASAQLEKLMRSEPLYGPFTRCALAFCLSALICPLAFGGSFLDMWIAGLGATFLSLMQVLVAARSQLYANVFEISITIVISFGARGLSAIRSEVFCYTAISSASIIGILPGYLILSSSLELASKNIVCGSVKMVYALIYTLFLGFGLQIGSDLFLLLDKGARHELAALAARMQTVTTITGSFVSDNGSFVAINHGDSDSLSGTFTFTSNAPYTHEHIVVGCYRPPDFPWWLQPFPWWMEFIIVPVFSFLSSLANLQPIWSLELVIMVTISCVSYAANKGANLFIFNRSDVVSAIGAFAVGVLGNIYSRKMGGTAFTSMVTGVLFLVPSGLSQAGGITAQGSGIDIGGAMISVTIGITVGLFMSQALVYMFGSRKNAAIFSF